MNYITPKEAAEKWNISRRRVNVLCREGRIGGVEWHGGIWMIPEAAEKPADARRGRKRTAAVLKNRTLRAEIQGEAGEQRGAEIQGEKELFLSPEHTVSRPRLLSKLAPRGAKLTFIHADAGYGKTTLLMQYAKDCSNAVWISLDENDNDPLRFLHLMEDSLREKLCSFDFHSIDYFPFVESGSFANAVLPALQQAIGNRPLTVIMDDVHLIVNQQLIVLLTEWVIKSKSNLIFLMAGRHGLWSGFFRLKMSGRVSELTKEDLAFSREEAETLWGFFDVEAYDATEGWSLAIQSYRIAAESSGRETMASIRINRDLYRYLFHEIFLKLSQEMQYFLKATSFLPLLEPLNCDRLLETDHSDRILSELVRRNLFTLQLTSSTYRYHTLFRSFLQQNEDGLGKEVLRRAMNFYYEREAYEEAADHAFILKDGDMIQRCISAIQDRPLVRSRWQNLKKLFDFLEANSAKLQPRVLLAKGMFLSDQGDFNEAERYLNAAILHLDSKEKLIYLHAMIHKARVLRNRVSIEASSHCIDSLLPLLTEVPMQERYAVVIEKIHNLTITSRLTEALELTLDMMDQCIESGAYGVKGWFERYLTGIYFYMGDFKNCLTAYEKSLSIPQEELDWLMRHSVGAYAAKAYQVAGQEEKALPLLEAELDRMRRLEFYEEFSVVYLVYAEVLHAAELLKLYRGESADFSEAYCYLDKAEEYAVLNRSTRDHYLVARIWKHCSGLLLQPEQIEGSVSEALALIREVTPFWQTLAYGRIANALSTLNQNPEQYREYYKRCIEIGEAVGSYAYAAIAFGRLAYFSLEDGDEAAARDYTRRLMEATCKRDHRYYFQFKPLFAPILKLAEENGITPEFTRQMLLYGGYRLQRVYINTLGRFSTAPVYDREKPVKIRTQKSRELLAYLLEHRNGVAKERIYADLWGDSEADVTRLFHTRRGEIRKAFENMGAHNPILYENGLYRLNMEEIICDHDDFLRAAEEFRQEPSAEKALCVVDRYTGRYLDDMEALWSESSRLQYEDAFLEAAEVLLEHYRETGQRAKTMELLRRCTGLSYYGQRYEE